MSLAGRLSLGLAPALLVALGVLAQLDARPSTLLVVYAAATLAHGWVAASRPSYRGQLAWSAGLLGVLVFAPAVFSDDIHRYVWDGRLLANGISPYAAAPDSPTLAAFRDASWSQINHPRIATIYPPLAVLGFALVQPLGIHGPKLLAALAALAIVALVSREERAGRAPRGATHAVGGFPPFLVESGLEGHIDFVALLALVLALLRLREGRTLQAAWFAALAVLTKLVGVLLLPSLARRNLAAMALVLVATVAALAPLTRSGGRSESAGLAHYGRRWSGGSPGYALVERTSEHALLAAFGAGGRQLRIPASARSSAIFAGTPLDPRVDLSAERKTPPRTATLHVSLVAPLLARVLLATSALVLALASVRRERDPLVTTRRVLFFLLLFAPRLLPWYALYLVPLDALLGRRAGLGFASVALLAHVPAERWQSERIYQEPMLAHALGFVLVLVALLLEWLETRREAQRSSRLDSALA